MNYTDDMALRMTNDFIFHYVFGRPESVPVLLKLVNAVLVDAGSPPVVSLELRNPVSPRDARWAKETVLDVKAIDENHRQIDIEVQVVGNRYFVNRSLYYWARLYSDQLERGNQYHMIRPVVCINLLNFVLFPDTPEYHHHFIITDAKNPQRQLTEDLQLHFVELEKRSEQDVPLTWWAELIENAGLEGIDMQVLLSKDIALSKAYEDYERCTQDREMRELALARERYERDHRTDLAIALEEGLEAGMAKGHEEGKTAGKAEGKAEIARGMIARGMDKVTIADITGFSLQELAVLASSGPPPTAK